MNNNRITAANTEATINNATKHSFFASSKAKSATKPVNAPSKAEKWLEKIFGKLDQGLDVALAMAAPLGYALGRILATIIIAGIGINIASEFWPELKSEIPYIYGFFDGCLNGVEWLFKYAADFFQQHIAK